MFNPSSARGRHGRRLHLVFSCLGLGVIFAVATGCTAMPTSPELGENAAAVDAPTYKVIFANNMGGQPEIYTGRLDGPATVQQALEDSGALRRYKAMRVDLAREVPEKGTILRLPVLFDPEAGHVIDAQNYALHPGDEILVRKESRSALTAVLGALGGK